jgi:hypothetical protein
LAPSPKERVRLPEPPSPWENEDWVAFLGSLPPEVPAVPAEPAKVRRAMLGTIDLGAWVQSAIDELANLD